MKIGYARVSTSDQNLDMQIHDLEKAGCEKIFKEKKSALKERPELEKLLTHIRKGDCVVVWKIDRLGRSLKHLVELISLFKDKKVDFKSLHDNIDSTTTQGRFIFNLLASFAEFEHDLIVERTKAGLARARENGRIGGRRPGLDNEAQKTAMNILRLSRANNKLFPDDRQSVQEMMDSFHVSRATYYRYIEWAKKHEEEKLKKKVK